MLENQIPNTVSLDALTPANTRAFFADPSKKNQRFNVYDPYVRYAAMNVSKGHMDNLTLRKAVFFAIDTQALIDLSGGREFYGDPGDNPVKPVLGLDYTKTTGNIHDPNWKITGNADYAKSLVESIKSSDPAAYKKATVDGIVWDIAQSATNQKAAVLISDAAKAAGIIIKFNFIPSGQYYSTVQNSEKQNDISTAGWGADWANASTVLPELFTKEGGFNLSQNWNDAAYPAFKKLSDSGKNETNRNKQAAIWKKASQYVMDQYWIIRPVFSKAQDVWGSKVGGVYYWEPQGTFGFGGLYVKA
jgi:peptide/nickel transport system substrate-binding protein